MCQQGWSTLHLASRLQWRNQKIQLDHYPLQSLHRRQFQFPNKRTGPTGKTELTQDHNQAVLSVYPWVYFTNKH